jgi:hypothetical protein
VLACLPCLPASCCQLLPPKPPLAPLLLACLVSVHAFVHIRSRVRRGKCVHPFLPSPPDIMRQPWHTPTQEQALSQQEANQSPLSHAPRPRPTTDTGRPDRTGATHLWGAYAPGG